MVVSRSKGAAAGMGVHLSTPKTEKFSQEGEGVRVRYGLASMQGWRTTMEDAHAALPDLEEHTSFFGVFDGHGAHPKTDITGKSVAKFCAKYLHVQVLKYEAKSFGDLATAAKKAYFRIDEMMKGHRGWRELTELGDKGQKCAGVLEGVRWTPKPGEYPRPWDNWSEDGPHSDFEGPTCGSTACVAIIRNDQLVVANAGDSRCIISRKGQAHNLSRDHKPDLATEKERINKAGGFVAAGRVNGSLNFTRTLGAMELKKNIRLPADRQMVSAEPEVMTIQLSEADEFIVLACDGIWDCMSSQDVVDFVHEQLRTENSLSAVCEKMLDRCLAAEVSGEGCDNMTVILVQFKKPIKSAATTSRAEQSAATSEGLRPNEPDDPTSSSNYLETSAKDATNVEKAFITMAAETKNRIYVPQMTTNRTGVTSAAAKGEGSKVPFHEYSCTWSTFQVPGGCKFPELSVDSPLLHLYSPVNSSDEAELLKQQFLDALSSSPKWWHTLLSHYPVSVRNPEKAMSALVRAHGSRDRALLDSVDRCMNCPTKKKSPATWVCSCCSLRLCSQCLAPGFLRKHGPCVKHGAVGILPEARSAVMPLMVIEQGLTLYCARESIYLVEGACGRVRMKRDGFCLRHYVCLDDVLSRTTARTCVILFHISGAGDLQIIFHSPLICK